MRADETKYETEFVPRGRFERLFEGAYAVAFLGAALYFAVDGLTESKSDSNSYFLAILLGAVGVGIGLDAAFRAGSTQWTAAGVAQKGIDDEAAAAKERFESEAADRRMKAFLNHVCIRYPVGIAAFWAAWRIAFVEQDQTFGIQNPSTHYLALLCATGVGLWGTREIAKPIIGLGAAWFVIKVVIYDVHLLSTPAAIIIGACIIACAIAVNRRR